jgi:hypothetical protein
MAKLDSQPLTAADLSDYLKSSDDFQFELEVLQSCLEADPSAEHGGTYQDPVTDKDRQFDIRMSVRKGSCILKLAIECKNLRTNFPLLVSRVPRRQEESFHEIVISRRRYANIHPVVPTRLYESNQMVGKSTVQVGLPPREGKKSQSKREFVSGDTEVYEKWTQAIASAFDLVSRSGLDYQTTGFCASTVILPILIVPEKTLWVADYSGKGRALGQPTRSDECSLFLGKDISTHWPPEMRPVVYRISHLQIFTKPGFDGYLDRLTNAKFRDRIFPSTSLGPKMQPEE